MGAVYPAGTLGKLEGRCPSSCSCSSPSPAAPLAAFLASRYPTPVIGQEPVRRGVRAAGRGGREAAVAPARARRSARPADRDRARPDPRARARDRRRPRRRRPRVPHAVERHARLRRQQRRRMGRRPRDALVDARDPARDRPREHLVRDRPRGRRLRRRVRARAEPVDSRLPPHGGRRRGRARELDQGAPPPRAADVQPDRRDARPLVPERPLGDCRGVLRRRCARPGTAPQPAGAVAARRCGGRDRDRRRREPRPARRPLALGRRRRPRLRLGLVRALRDRVRRPVPELRRAGGEGDPRRGARRGRSATTR